MRKRFVVAMLATSAVICGLGIQSVSAISADLVVSRVQTKSLVGGSASQELIELYNNADTDTDITDWCIEYGQKSTDLVTADPAASSVLNCFASSRGGDDKVFVSGRSTVILISKVMNEQFSLLGFDALFNSGLADSDRWVRIKNAHHNIIDKVEWSGVGGVLSVSAEGGKTAPSQTSTLLIGRKNVTPIQLQDTDDNFDDFERVAAPMNYSYGSIYEVEDSCTNIADFQTTVPANYIADGSGICTPPPVDICTNIDGLQLVIPAGYAMGSDGLCQADACTNIDGLQVDIPADKDSGGAGACIDHDYCSNIAGIQAMLPTGYMFSEVDTCLLDLEPLFINEVFANAIGDDTGHEFIEIYNPNNSTISLDPYGLTIGIDIPKFYTFPSGSVIAPYAYVVFSDDDIAFTLVNTASQVSLTSIDAQPIDQSPIYNNPLDGMAWAQIAGVWQYTNQPTPGTDNLSSLFTQDVTEETVSGLQPCAPNQYRNPETNRCRLLVTAGSTLTPCKDGQYRSEVTNRCRSISADATTLAPCNDNQERNPETNRCRLIASNSLDLAACKEGQERNTETNRCRTVVNSIPDVGFAVQPIADTGSAAIAWWAVGGISILALGYAAWEWREELRRAIQKLGTFFHSGK